MWQLLLVAVLVAGSDGVKVQMTVSNDYTGKFEGKFSVHATSDTIDGWLLDITFCEAITGFSVIQNTERQLLQMSLKH